MAVAPGHRATTPPAYRPKRSTRPTAKGESHLRGIQRGLDDLVQDLQHIGTWQALTAQAEVSRARSKVKAALGHLRG